MNIFYKKSDVTFGPLHHQFFYIKNNTLPIPTINKSSWYSLKLIVNFFIKSTLTIQTKNLSVSRSIKLSIKLSNILDAIKKTIKSINALSSFPTERKYIILNCENSMHNTTSFVYSAQTE